MEPIVTVMFHWYVTYQFQNEDRIEDLTFVLYCTHISSATKQALIQQIRVQFYKIEHK